MGYLFWAQKVAYTGPILDPCLNVGGDYYTLVDISGALNHISCKPQKAKDISKTDFLGPSKHHFPMLGVDGGGTQGGSVPLTFQYTIPF